MGKNDARPVYLFGSTMIQCYYQVCRCGGVYVNPSEFAHVVDIGQGAPVGNHA